MPIVTLRATSFNNHKIYIPPTEYFWALYVSHDKQRLFRYTISLFGFYDADQLFSLRSTERIFT